MKRLVAASLLALVLGLTTAGPARAVPDEYDDTQSHPLRIAAYLLYPVGYTVEWLVLRPFHYIISRPHLEPVFGHGPHQEVGTY